VRVEKHCCEIDKGSIGGLDRVLFSAKKEIEKSGKAWIWL